MWEDENYIIKVLIFKQINYDFEVLKTTSLSSYFNFHNK